MAGTVRALLLKVPEAGRLPVVPLAPGSGLALLPLTGEIVASLGLTGDSDERVDGFYDLTSEVAEWARRCSRQGVVAYLHTEFFGGTGFHAAVAWQDGAIAWGPLFTANAAGEAEDHYVTVTDLRDMAVNVLLRWLGVQRADRIDEYTAVGLSRCRWTEEWAELGCGASGDTVGSAG